MRYAYSLKQNQFPARRPPDGSEGLRVFETFETQLKREPEWDEDFSYWNRP
jgi:hypothetical protein